MYKVYGSPQCPIAVWAGEHEYGQRQILVAMSTSTVDMAVLCAYRLLRFQMKFFLLYKRANVVSTVKRLTGVFDFQ